jgi:hypothetical protein
MFGLHDVTVVEQADDLRALAYLSGAVSETHPD